MWRHMRNRPNVSALTSMQVSRERKILKRTKKLPLPRWYHKFSKHLSCAPGRLRWRYDLQAQRALKYTPRGYLWILPQALQQTPAASLIASEYVWICARLARWNLSWHGRKTWIMQWQICTPSYITRDLKAPTSMAVVSSHSAGSISVFTSRNTSPAAFVAPGRAARMGYQPLTSMIMAETDVRLE